MDKHVFQIHYQIYNNSCYLRMTLYFFSRDDLKLYFIKTSMYNNSYYLGMTLFLFLEMIRKIIVSIKTKVSFR